MNFNPIYEVAAGVTNYAVTGLNPDTQYWFQAEADSVNGQSAPSTIGPIFTSYQQPQLLVTPTASATEGQPISLALTWNANPGEPSSDDVQYWLINFDDGNGTQQYTAAASGSVLSETSLQYAPTTASAAITVQAVAYSGLTLPALNQTFYFAPTAPTSVTASYGNSGTSATINWYDDSQIAADYLVQRELAGSGWATVQTVSAGSSTNTWTDPSLIAGPYGGGGGYIYRVIAQGPQITEGVTPPTRRRRFCREFQGQ